MQVQNLLIYSSAIAVSNSGPWIDVSNLVSMSVQVNNVGSAGIEVSNDPNVQINSTAGIGAPSVAPTLKQFASLTQGYANLTGGSVSVPGAIGGPPDISQLPEPITFFVKTTFITKWGETVPSSESSLSVTTSTVNGVVYPNYLLVAAPVPTAAQAPFVIGWNCYVSKTTGAEVLQTVPNYTPQRLVDGIGTVGGTVQPLVGQSTHFAISGALPLQANFSMVNGFKQTQWSVPGADTSGGTNSGVNVGSLTAPMDNTSVAVFYVAPNSMWSPSSMTWKFIRVVGGGATTLAYLNGQRG